MAQTESQKTRNLKTLLRARGFFVYKTHGSTETMSGLPDLVGCKDGRFIGIEVKMLDTANTKFKYTPKQVYVLEQLAAKGALVFGAGCIKRHVEERVGVNEYWILDNSFIAEGKTSPMSLTELVDGICAFCESGWRKP